jgi:hypothetical protein
VQKSLNTLISSGTVPSPWNITGAVGVTDNGCIVGTATYTSQGPDDPIQSGMHGYLLVPVPVNAVCFSGSSYWQLESDDATKQYVAPQWTGTFNTTGLGDQNYPVAYTRNTVPQISGTFKIPANLGLTNIKIQASGPDGIGIPPTAASVGAGGIVTLPVTSSTAALPNTIKYYNKADSTAFALNWRISFDGGNTWSQFATTKHTVYVTLVKPLAATWQESLFEIGCREANGMQGDPSDSNFVAKLTQTLFTDFAILSVKRADGTPLTYYADYNTPAQHTALLLSGGDGQCQAWAELFLDIREVQGLYGDNYLVQILPIGTVATGFIVNNWNFNANGGTSGNPDFPFLNIPAVIPPTLQTSYSWTSAEVTQGQGIAGENNKTPASLFGGHVIVQAANKYYDPSYGATPIRPTDIKNSLAGFYLVVTPPVPYATQYLFNQNPNMPLQSVTLPYPLN